MSNEVFTGGATTSQHIEATDDDHFNNTTFQLKRTRSLGLLDEFIPTKLEDSNDDDNTSRYHQNEANDNENKSDTKDNKDLKDKGKDGKEDVSTFKSPEFIPLDDNDIEAEPVIHVDYFSHQWDVGDISKSWRYIIQKRKDVANSARLENASWRTWAQRRLNLKTINPEKLNWSKENDITWLYGPILKDEHNEIENENEHNHDNHNENEDEKVTHHSNTASSAVAGDISIPSKKPPHNKGILKKRSVEDVMISHANLVKLEAIEQRLKLKKEKQRQQLENYKKSLGHGHKRNSSNEPPEFDDYDAISEKLNSQYKFSSSNLKDLANQSQSQVNSQTNLKNFDKNSNLNDFKLDDVHDKNNDNVKIDNDNNNDSNSNSNNNGNNNNGNGDDNLNSLNDIDNTISIDSISNSNLNSISNLNSNDSIDLIDKKSRHIHFNTEVQQCIAVDPDDVVGGNNNNDDDEYDDDDNDYEYDDYSQKSYIFTGDDLGDQEFNNDNDDNIVEVGEDEDDKEDDDDDDDDDDDNGGFFLKVRSPSSSSLAPQFNRFKLDAEPSPPTTSQKTDDTDSISTNNSKMYRTIQLLPSTNINWGSDDETSDDENPYTSSMSHNVNNNTSRGYDYYYDYNTVYTCDDNGIYHQVNQDLPDVVDLPEDLAKFGNFDNVPIIDSQIIHNQNYDQFESNNSGGASNSGTSANTDTNPGSGSIAGFNSNTNSGNIADPPRSNFNLDDSDSDDSDSDEGLSIGTRSSSQSLAQQIYGSMTPSNNNNPSNNATGAGAGNVSGFNPSPITQNIKSINPRHSSTGLSKQSTSSNSLSDQFFGTTPIEKDDLSSQFFGTTTSTNTNTTNTNSNSPGAVPVPGRVSPLPPTTTQTNIFLGKGFSFDSDSDEYVEDISD